MHQWIRAKSANAIMQIALMRNANGIVAGVASLTNIAGPVLGGVLYGVIGINAIIVISCVSFF
ncbi:hypothetical protein ACTPEF_24900, partial [Clostridioides difficile]